jgi:colanic acid biosynthesis glycosyl transferase WcaI
MVTSFCYYPAWQKLPTERHLLFRTDQMEEVTVHRCWHFVPQKVTTLKRALHELSFVVTSFCRLLTLPRADLLVVISPPLLLGFAAWLLSKLKGSPFVFHLQDLQPDAAAGLEMLKEGFLLEVLRKLEAFAYAKAVRVSAITPGMLRACEKKGVPKSKLIYFPNGIELPDFWRLPQRGNFREAHGFAPSDFLVVYSGNMGRKQGLELLLEAAARCVNARIRFVLCGDGVERIALEKKAAELALTNVQFIRLLAEPRYRELLVDADLMVIPQQAGSGHCFFPSKLLTALAFSRPVLTISDPGTELSRAVEEGEFGAVLAPGNPKHLSEKIHELANQPELLSAWGRTGFKFVKRFEQASVHAEFGKNIETIDLKK